MIKVIDYKAGNAPSVLHAITHLGYNASFAKHPKDLADATHIILPGVGSASATMESLKELDLISSLEDAVLTRKVMFLGICIGLQVLFEASEESEKDQDAATDCLGWLKGQVVKFNTDNIRVPQMGWNKVSFIKGSGLPNQDDYFYFVNSYYAKPTDNSMIWGTAQYDSTFTAAICKNNIYATQFHVEKSGRAGLELLDRFLNA